MTNKHDPAQHLEFEPTNPPQSVFEIDQNPPSETDDSLPSQTRKTLHNGTLLGIGIFQGLLFVFWVIPASTYAAFKAADLFVNGPLNFRPSHEDDLLIPSAVASINFLLVLTLLPNYLWIENRKL